MFNYLQETSIFVMRFKKLRVISDVYENSMIHSLAANLSRFVHIVFKYSIFGKPICRKGCDIISISENSYFINLSVILVIECKKKLKSYIQNSIAKRSSDKIASWLFDSSQWKEARKTSFLLNVNNYCKF